MFAEEDARRDFIHWHSRKLLYRCFFSSLGNAPPPSSGNAQSLSFALVRTDPTGERLPSLWLQTGVKPRRENTFSESLGTIIDCSSKCFYSLWRRECRVNFDVLVRWSIENSSQSSPLCDSIRTAALALVRLIKGRRCLGWMNLKPCFSSFFFRPAAAPRAGMRLLSILDSRLGVAPSWSQLAPDVNTL